MYKRKQPAFYKQNTKDSGAELTLFYNMALDADKHFTISI
jgi:hypothetical protein